MIDSVLNSMEINLNLTHFNLNVPLRSLLLLVCGNGRIGRDGQAESRNAINDKIFEKKN